MFQESWLTVIVDCGFNMRVPLDLEHRDAKVGPLFRTMRWLELSQSIKANPLEPAPKRPKRSRAWNCLA